MKDTKTQLPLLVLSVNGDLERPLEALNSRFTKVLERCRVLFSSGSFPFCFFSFFCVISTGHQQKVTLSVQPLPRVLKSPEASPATVTWLCDLLMSRLGMLRASSMAVLGDSFVPLSSSPRINVSLSRVVRPRLRVVSAPVL